MAQQSQNFAPLLFDPLLDFSEYQRRLSRLKGFFKEPSQGEGAYFLIEAKDPERVKKYPRPVSPRTLVERWLSAPLRAREALWECQTTYPAGDCLPRAYVEFGAAYLPALLGAPYRLDADTIWFDHFPPIIDLKNYPPLKLHRDWLFYRAVTETTRELASISKDRFLVGIGFIGSNLDVFLSLMERERALMELIKNPELVLNLLENITELSLEFFRDLLDLIEHSGGEHSFATPLAFKGPGGKLLSDSSKMLSLESFKDFILPSLISEANFMGEAFYGLDAAAHLLPAILEIPEIKAIEWHPPTLVEASSGEGIRDFFTKESLNVCHQIQESKRKLILTGLSPVDAEKILSVLKPDGLMLSIYAKDPSEADSLWKLFRKFTSV
ncbi:MAG: hypothetical protein LBE27_02370 [Deltaproteobacteria bacterium]|jgi:hypothetical protein|nr:hypothetical protein [Deltaproteobacteria bacterium]